MLYDLVVVMPVYNEQDCIVSVVESWHAVLSKLKIHFQIIVLNDGSTDDTQKVLDIFTHNEQVEIINKPNSGHGPTILMGYHKAAEMGQWVFQCDSDDEMKAVHFPKLWTERDKYIALFGIRTDRHQNSGRKLISLLSRLMVKGLFGKGVTDVNTPYRLIQAKALKCIISQIPNTTFAPNVIISGALTKAKLPLQNIPVPHQVRQTGQISIVKWRLWRAAIRSFWQTLSCRFKMDLSDLHQFKKINH